MTIKAIVIDDEFLMEQNIATILENEEKLEIIESFTSPYEGLVEILEVIPDVVILEIEMNEMNGIKIAEIIKHNYPHIQIVFITKSKSHAIQAYEVNATDYLLKPVEKERINITIKRLKKNLLVNEVQYTEMIGMFRGLYFRDSNNELITSVRWRTKKTEELFAYLLYKHDKSVSTDLLIDMLWPHVDSIQGITLLYSAIYQIRQKTKKINFGVEVVSKNNTYMLKLNNIQFDVQIWENAMDHLPNLTLNTLHEHLQVIKMYKGDFLLKNNYSWAEEERIMLNTIWWYHVQGVIDHLIFHEKHMEAIRLLNHVKKVSTDYDKIYFNLMKLYALINDSERVEHYYNKLKRLLLTEFSINPPIETVDWYDSWLKVNKGLDLMDAER